KTRTRRTRSSTSATSTAASSHRRICTRRSRASPCLRDRRPGFRFRGRPTGTPPRALVRRVACTPVFMLIDCLDRLERFYGHLPAPPADPFGVYVWEVLSIHSTPARRDAAMTALRKIPALTPDALAKAAPKKLEDAAALAGSHREERVRALKAGVDAFRRKPKIASEIRAALPAAAAVIETLPHLSAAGGERLLLFAGQHPIVPFDPAHARVAVRLGLGASADAASRPRAALDEFAAALS